MLVSSPFWADICVPFSELQQLTVKLDPRAAEDKEHVLISRAATADRQIPNFLFLYEERNGRPFFDLADFPGLMEELDSLKPGDMFHFSTSLPGGGWREVDLLLIEKKDGYVAVPASCVNMEA